MFTLFLRELPVYLAPSGVRVDPERSRTSARLPRQRMRWAGQAASWCGKKNRLLFALAQREVSGDEAS